MTISVSAMDRSPIQTHTLDITKPSRAPNANVVGCGKSIGDASYPDAHIHPIGKYVVGLKKLVEREMADKCSSKTFRRHSTSSIESEGMGCVGRCGVRVCSEDVA
jgi:hypothetical protein